MTRWTDAEVLRLTELHADGLRVTAIARRLGRTVYGVREKARMLGLTWRTRAQRAAHAGTLAAEIEAAKRERATAPLYRPGDRV